MGHHHHHHHHHHHVDAKAGDSRVAWAVAVNMGLTLAQVIGGLASGSLALIADALHNFSDALSILIAFVARKIARRPADDRMTFGYGRAEMIAALINYTTLIVTGFYLTVEAVMRFFDPQPVTGWIVVAIAGVALVVDLVTALLTYAMQDDSANIRAVFLHNLADALGSVAVIVAGSLILIYDWRLVDPLVTLGIAAYILWMALAEIGGVIRMLMLGTPPGMVAGEVLDTVRTTDGVAGLHRARLWQLDEHHNTLDLHVVVAADDWHRADDIKADVRTRLHDRHDIASASIELECADHACQGAPMYGH